MKTIQIKFKTLLLALIVSIAFTSCSKDDDGPGDPDPQGNEPPVLLDCAYFDANPSVHLVDNPNAPIDYLIACDPMLSEDFIIDAGVVIEFESEAGLRLGKYGNGKIQMNGTAEKPIILTGTQKDKGTWRGIQVSSDNPANQMKYVTIEYAGQAGRNGWGQKGALIGVAGGVMKIDYCTVQYGANYGLHWVGGALNAGKLTLSNSVFTGNDIPVQTNINHINSIDGSSTYTGNVNDYIKLINGGAYQDVTFHKTDVPFFTDGFGPDNDAKRRFTFKPGVTLLMDAGSEIRSDNAFHYQHDFIMVGTAQDRITIKGKENVPGYWKGIRVETDSPLNEIGFLDISNAGNTTGHPNGAVKLDIAAFLNIHDVNFINCFEYGMSLHYYWPMDPFHLEYSNLTLINTPKMFSDWEGAEVIDPENP